MATANGTYFCYTEPGTETVLPLTGSMQSNRLLALLEAQGAAAYRYGCLSRYGLTQCGYPATRAGEARLQAVMASSRDERERLDGLGKPLPVYGGLGHYLESIVFTLDGGGQLVSEQRHSAYAGPYQPAPFVHALTCLSGSERGAAMQTHEREARLSGVGTAYLVLVCVPPHLPCFTPLVGDLSYVEALTLVEAQGERRSHYRAMTRTEVNQACGYTPGREGNEAIQQTMDVNRAELQVLAGLGTPLPIQVIPRWCGYGHSRQAEVSHVVVFDLDPRGRLNRSRHPPTDGKSV